MGAGRKVVVEILHDHIEQLLNRSEGKTRFTVMSATADNITGRILLTVRDQESQTIVYPRSDPPLLETRVSRSGELVVGP